MNRNFDAAKEEIKNRFSVETILARFGHHPERGGFYRCPFHDDRTPSLKVDGKRWHCFGACGVGGDVIDLACLLTGKRYAEAVFWFRDTFGLSTMPTNGERPPVPPCEKATAGEASTRRERVAAPIAAPPEVLSAFLGLLTLTARGGEYLRGRCISAATARRYNLRSLDTPGAVIGKMKERFPEDALCASGLFTRREGKEGGGYLQFLFSMPSIIIPIFENGAPVYLVGREIGGARKMKPRGITPRPFFGDFAPDEEGDLFLFEGAFDALSFVELFGKGNFLTLHGLPSVRQFGEIVKSYPCRRVVLALDNDKAGERATAAIQAAHLPADVPVERWDTLKAKHGITGPMKDLNEILCAVTRG